MKSDNNFWQGSTLPYKLQQTQLLFRGIHERLLLPLPPKFDHTKHAVIAGVGITNAQLTERCSLSTIQKLLALNMNPNKQTSMMMAMNAV
ncbi:MAG: hypothetical protein AAB800_02990 [Patescibacteria group bacterium]